MTDDTNFAQIKIFYDRDGNTLTIWLGDPRDEYMCEETGDEVILMKNKAGRVIGFEKLNYVLPHPADLRVALEASIA